MIKKSCDLFPKVGVSFKPSFRIRLIKVIELIYSSKIFRFSYDDSIPK